MFVLAVTTIPLKNIPILHKIIVVSIEVPTPEQVAALDPATRAALAAAYLGGVEADANGLLPYGVFVAIAGKIPLSTVEVVPLRQNPNTGNTEALLLQRPSTDAWWANRWHIPGTAVRGNDTVAHDDEIDFDDPLFDPLDSYRTPVERLMENELKGGVRLADGPHLSGARFRRGVRGPESTVMLLAGVEVVNAEQPLPAGRFFDVAELAANPPDEGLVVGHAYAVARAAARYAILNT